HPLAKAGTFDVQAKMYAEKTAFNMPNPEINVESPTGEFYAVGVSQSFEFPTIYSRQKKVAKATTALAQAGQRVSENDLRFTVRSLYLEAQLAAYQSRQWAERDSLYQAIAAAAARQFNAGEIDFLQKTMTDNEAGNVHQERLAAEQKSATLYQQLATFTGLTNPGTLSPLLADTVGMFLIPDIANNPSVVYEQQVVQLSERQISLAKSRALPNFSLGYLNQGASNTPVEYRFRAGIGIPLWVGQYSAGTKSTKAENQAAAARAEAQRQAVALELQRVRTEAVTAFRQVQYSEQEALPRSRSLIVAALRMREAGQMDYLAFLRTLDEAYSIQRNYTTQTQAFETARIQMLYLTGQ
ncbi:MAG TPA: TolC family protein, partial [Saprospiraceae bacterium]|nr:TolC family protein [Saprospiraceae bacterium]